MLAAAARFLPRLAAGLLLSLVVIAQASAQIAPNAEWRTLRTPHFRVTFTPELEPAARRVATYAEDAHALFTRELTRAPSGTIDIILTNAADLPNGYATPFPGNTIVLYATPPTANIALAHNRDWYELLVVHELAHIFDRDRTGVLGSVLRRIFGRVPAPWPFFPSIGTPSWATEGLATLWESQATGFGRVHGSYHEMVLRTAALAGTFEPIDRASGISPHWPGPMRAYIYGSLFDEYIARTYGDSAHAKLVEATARALIPAPVAYDRIGKKVLGVSFTRAWESWRQQVTAEASAVLDSVARAGATPVQRLTSDGYYAFHPRVSPDGQLVAFAMQNGRDAASTSLLVARSGEVRRLARRDGGGLLLGPAAWLPDGSGLITAQLRTDGRYSIVHDLFRVTLDGVEEQLTDGARLSTPDVSPDGRRVVAVQSGAGANRLVIVELEDGGIRPLGAFDLDTLWAYPRWSPDGHSIAASRWQTGGAYDVVVLDTTGALTRTVTAGPGIDASPVWSPDGRYLLFGSDRSGIPEIYAVDLHEPTEAAPLQATHLVTGAFQPDVSPDGEWLYFAMYHADGFHIARVPFTPGRWRRAAPVEPTMPEFEPPTPSAAPLRDYSAWKTIRPRYWLPLYDEASGTGHTAGEFFGVFTSGSDVVGRHAYSAQLGVDPSRRRALWSLDYRWAGLGDPVLSLAAGNEWDVRLALGPDDRPTALVSHERTVGARAAFAFRGMRRSTTLTVGPEFTYESLTTPELPDSFRLRDPTDELLGMVVGVGYSSAQAHPFSISREDGVSLSLFGRHRSDLDARTVQGVTFDRGFNEAIVTGSGYRALGAPGFANHVLAARLAAVVSDGPGAGIRGAGGASGGEIGSLVGSIGHARELLPVRGFPEDTRFGTRGWSGSVEYRAPLALVGRGYRLWPLFLDRISAAVFLDAGDAWCTSGEIAARRCLEIWHSDGETLVGAGGEAAVDIAVFFDFPVRLRGGVGFPLRGPASEPRFYFRFGPSF